MPSRYQPSVPVCPVCGQTYSGFRTGYDYYTIYLMFWKSSDDPSTWVNKRRGSVLGRWHQIKMRLWDQHLTSCAGMNALECEGQESTTDLRELARILLGKGQFS